MSISPRRPAKGAWGPSSPTRPASVSRGVSPSCRNGCWRAKKRNGMLAHWDRLPRFFEQGAVGENNMLDKIGNFGGLFGGSKFDHPLADARELRTAIAELPADNAFKALDEVLGW